jgi:hypothetical protein
MSRRFLASRSTLAIVIVVALSMTLTAAGQTPTAGKTAPAPAAKKWTMPRTPDGAPDLQGYWTNNSYVPLERPNNVTKELYTPAEAEAAARAAAAREAEQTTPGTTADVHYDFTQFGLDRSQGTLVSNLRTSLIYDPPNGRIPPAIADATKRQQDRAAARKMLGGQYDAVQNMPLGSRCYFMGGSGPPLLGAGYNSNYHIVQNKTHVMILTEMIHDVRIISLEGNPHPPQDLQQWFGSSRGRWEGDTLVVETRNFSEKNPFRGLASPTMRLIERFTRVSDDQIKYTFTVEDEKTWAQPWSAEAPLQKTQGPIFEFACHEANFGVANILAGARADDKRAAEEAAKKGQK